MMIAWMNGRQTDPVNYEAINDNRDKHIGIIINDNVKGRLHFCCIYIPPIDSTSNDEEDYFYLVCLGGMAKLFSERLHLCRTCKVIIFESLCTSFKVSYIFESAWTLPEICSSLKPNHRFSQIFFLVNA